MRKAHKLTNSSGHPWRAPGYVQNMFDAPSRVTAWFKHKKKQLSAVITDENLKRALTSTITEPVEGAEYQIGDRINCVSFGGVGRRLQVCGIRFGGYANVYTVIDREEMKAYCLKTSRRLLTTDERVKNEKLKGEAKIWMAIDPHPNVVMADSVFEVNGRTHILIEYVSGSDLTSRLRGGPLPLKTALTYAVHVCRGLAHTSQSLPGFVHGDIKPGNCLITLDHLLKITDFGLADTIPLSDPRTATPDQLSGNTALHRRGGTPAYMSPEQFDSAALQDARSDIYSFGVTFYEMLTGVRPFHGPTREEYQRQHQEQPPPDPRAFNQEIPLPLVNLALRCLAKSAAERPAHFAVLEEQISELLWDQFQERIPAPVASDLTPPEMVRRGDSLMVLGEPGTALHYFEKALQVEPSLKEAWAQYGLALAVTDQFARATDCYEKVRQLAPTSFEALICCGKLLSRLGREAEAITYFESALRAKPHCALTWNRHGESLLALKKSCEAAKSLRSAATIDPHYVEPWGHLARLSMMAGNYEEAEAHAQRALKIDPQHFPALMTLGDIYEVRGLWPESVAAYKKAVAVQPDDRHARKRLLRTCCNFYAAVGGRLEKQLVGLLSEGLTGPRGDRPGLVGRALDLLRANAFDLLILYFLDEEIYEALDELSAGERHRLGEYLSQALQQKVARCVHLNAYHSVGKLLYGLDRYEECLSAFRASMEKYGPDDKSYYYLAACHEMLGQLPAALAYYTEAMRLDAACGLNYSGKQRVEGKLRELRKAASLKPEGVDRKFFYPPSIQTV